MPHVLDRPIYASLRSHHKSFATGDELALRYQEDVSPFACAADDENNSLAALGAMIPKGKSMMLLQAGAAPVPPGIAEEFRGEGVQMVLERLPAEPAGEMPPVVTLGEDDAAEMLELATLAKPGPFLPRTHRLGRFIGIRENGRLIAMAGERMRVPGYTEVSAVCTHPEHRGRGLASYLSRLVSEAILARGETPILHAWVQNEPALRIYRTLGFVERQRMAVVVMKRPN